MATGSSTVVQRLRNYCHVLRDGGVSFRAHSRPARLSRSSAGQQRVGGLGGSAVGKQRLLLIALALLLAGCTPAPSPPQAPATALASPPPPAMSPSPQPPQVGEDERWIEVDLAQQRVRLRQGAVVLAEYVAAAGVGTSPETTTYSGLFRVQYKEKGPLESVPGVFVADVVMFDLAHGNALHSRPMDKDGRILEEELGRPLTAGCVRTGESAAVFDFSALGMPVWVH